MEQLNTRYAILFDLDGTLIDSSVGIIDAYQFTLAYLELPPLDAVAIRGLIGPSIYEVLTEKFGVTGNIAQRGVNVFRQRYRDHGLFRFQKYDGIDDALRALLDHGFTLTIATSKLESMAEQIVANAGWAEIFNCVNGSNDDGKRSSKRDVINRALSRLPSNTNPFVMIGDTPLDIVAGHDSDLLGIGVSWGFGHIQELIESGAESIASEPSQLVDLVGALIKRSVSRESKIL